MLAFGTLLTLAQIYVNSKNNHEKAIIFDAPGPEALII